MKKILTIALSGILGSLFAMSANADVPSLLPVQGMLADASDQPVDDLVDMTFTIYPSELGGIPVWSEVYDGTNQVDVEDGFFTVYLGEVQTLDMGILADEPELWLGITVGTDSEMDRIRLATVPFAVEAHRCEQIGEITEADISGAPFYGITSSQVSGWDAASSWGDHSAAGYLTSEVDPLFSASPAATISASQVVDWDTAYGWGDHNGLYSPTGHKHDDIYYTETELQTSGAAQVNWDNLVNVPAGFADGIDDVNVGDITSVTAGSGLSGGGTSGDVSVSVGSNAITTNHIGWPAPVSMSFASQNYLTSCSSTVVATPEPVAAGSTTSTTNRYIGTMFHYEDSGYMSGNFNNARLSVVCEGYGYFELVDSCSSSATPIATISCTGNVARPWMKVSDAFNPDSNMPLNVRVRATSGTLEWWDLKLVLY